MILFFKTNFNHRKIITILFAAAVFFLIVNIVADKFSHKKTVPTYETSAEKINSIFISSLKNFGVDTSWIKTRKKKNDDSLYASYFVEIPNDLPIALLLKELYNSYDTNSISIYTQEMKIGGKTVLEISSGKQVKLVSEFNYNSEIKRKAGTVAFLLADPDELDEVEDSILLYSPEAFAAILTPSKAAEKLAARINKLRKEYIIELNDDIEELDYKLSSNYSEKRLKLSIRSIMGSFSKAILIMIDDNSDLYSSSIYPLIKSEFEKRNIKIVKRSLFKEFNNENLNDDLRNHFRGMEDAETKAVIISAEDYLSIQNVIVSFRKIGYKFVNPSLVIL